MKIDTAAITQVQGFYNYMTTYEGPVFLFETTKKYITNLDLSSEKKLHNMLILIKLILMNQNRVNMHKNLEEAADWQGGVTTYESIYHMIEKLSPSLYEFIEDIMFLMYKKKASFKSEVMQCDVCYVFIEPRMYNPNNFTGDIISVCKKLQNEMKGFDFFLLPYLPYDIVNSGDLNSEFYLKNIDGLPKKSMRDILDASNNILDNILKKGHQITFINYLVFSGNSNPYGTIPQWLLDILKAYSHLMGMYIVFEPETQNEIVIYLHGPESYNNYTEIYRSIIESIDHKTITNNDVLSTLPFFKKGTFIPISKNRASKQIGGSMTRQQEYYKKYIKYKSKYVNAKRNAL